MVSKGRLAKELIPAKLRVMKFSGICFGRRRSTVIRSFSEWC